MGVMESRAGRAGRDAERLGDLGGLVPQVVVQDEDRPLFGRQPAEPAVKLVPVGDGEQIVGCGRSVDRQYPKVRRSAALARRLDDADIDEEALEPRIEPVRIAEAPEVTPGDPSASCRASSARSMSRRIRWATANSRSLRTRIRSTYASRSPFRAASTRSRSTDPNSSSAPEGGAFRLYWSIASGERSFFVSIPAPPSLATAIRPAVCVAQTRPSTYGASQRARHQRKTSHQALAGREPPRTPRATVAETRAGSMCTGPNGRRTGMR